MEDYIYFSIDGRNLKIHKENPDDILMWKNNKYSPYWKQVSIFNGVNGYKTIKISSKLNKNYRLHRVNYYAHNQDWDIHNSCIKTNSIDHKDINPINNNIENLHVVTNQQNHFNRNCKGYYFNKSRQKWQAQIKKNGKVKHLGRFNTEEEARQAYLEAKKIYHKIE
jgi:hypothetical protein